MERQLLVHKPFITSCQGSPRHLPLLLEESFGDHSQTDLRNRIGEERREIDDLEQKVQTRTAEVSEADKHLKEEVGERKRIEEGLRGRESILRNILATSPVGIGLTENRIIKWSNESWMKMFGFEKEEEFVVQSTEMLYACGRV